MFEKMKLAKQIFDAYEDYRKKDENENGIPDLDEDIADAKEVYEAVKAHDAGLVLEKIEAIIRRSGDDVEAIVRKLAK